MKSQSTKRATTKCPTCGKEFSYWLSWPRKYCSKVCSGKATVTNFPNFVPNSYQTNCLECGKEFTARPSQTRGKFCSQKCFGLWNSKHVVGGAHPNKGKKFGRPSNLPPPTIATCVVCGDQFLTKPSHLSRRKTCSRGCSGALSSERNTGENNPLWRGGYEPYYGPTWRMAQRAARERDGKCMSCGYVPKEGEPKLDVHHVVPFRKFGIKRHSEANDLSNLLALCHTCHTKVEWVTTDRGQAT